MIYLSINLMHPFWIKQYIYLFVCLFVYLILYSCIYSFMADEVHKQKLFLNKR